jgi:hypothetical protein
MAVEDHLDSVGFHRKLVLAKALRYVNERQANVLQRLNKLRNRFAHSPTPDIDDPPLEYKNELLLTGNGLVRLRADVDRVLAEIADCACNRERTNGAAAPLRPPAYLTRQPDISTIPRWNPNPRT